MKKLRAIVLTLATLLVALPAAAFQPNVNDKMELDVAKAILAIKKADPGIEAFFESAAGYAVFPSVGRAGVVVGGAYGNGLVIVGEGVDGYTSMTQATVGLQLGGQVHSLFIFFKDDTALNYKMMEHANQFDVSPQEEKPKPSAEEIEANKAKWCWCG